MVAPSTTDPSSSLTVTGSLTAPKSPAAANGPSVETVAIVIVSKLALAVILIPVPPTSVSVSLILSACTGLCPLIKTLLN